MREILFRGKRVDNGEWVYGGFSHDVPYICRMSPDDNDKVFIVTGLENFIVERGTVCEYTGLTDKNGSKIFEGDFLSTRTGENHYVYLVVYGLVECSGYGFGVEGVILDGSSYADYSGELCPLNVFLEDHVPMMVIGNVHDSPKVESCRWRNAECER